MRLGLALALAIITPLPAVARHLPAAAGQNLSGESEVDTALAAINEKRPGDAIAILDPILADYEAKYASDSRPIYCAENTGEAGRYLLGVGLKPQPGKISGHGIRVLGLDWCSALWAKGFALIDLGKLDEAVSFLERSAMMAPDHAHFVSELGFAYQTQKRWNDSLEAYTSAAKDAERYTGSDRVRELGRAWRGAGFVLVELGRWDEAEAIYRKCLELNPDDAKAKGELEYIANHRKNRS